MDSSVGAGVLRRCCLVVAPAPFVFASAVVVYFKRTVGSELLAVPADDVGGDRRYRPGWRQREKPFYLCDALLSFFACV